MIGNEEGEDPKREGGHHPQGTATLTKRCSFGGISRTGPEPLRTQLPLASQRPLSLTQSSRGPFSCLGHGGGKCSSQARTRRLRQVPPNVLGGCVTPTARSPRHHCPPCSGVGGTFPAPPQTLLALPPVQLPGLAWLPCFQPPRKPLHAWLRFEHLVAGFRFQRDWALAAAGLGQICHQ